MMKKQALFPFILVAGALLYGAHAVAADKSGWYVSGGAGYSKVQTRSNSFSMDAFSMESMGTIYSGDAHFWGLSSDSRSKFNSGLGVGYDFAAHFGTPVRVDLSWIHHAGAALTSEGPMDFSGTFDAGYGPQPFGEHGTLYNTPKPRVNSLMMGAWYDINTGTAFTPYLGAMAGYSRIKGNLTVALVTDEESEAMSQRFSESRFSWGLGAGVAFDISPDMKLDLGYRYINFGKITQTLQEEDVYYHNRAKLTSHDINVALRYAF